MWSSWTTSGRRQRLSGGNWTSSFSLFLNIKKSVSQPSLNSQIDPEKGLIRITNNNFWVIKCEVIIGFPLCLLMSLSLVQIRVLADFMTYWIYNRPIFLTVCILHLLGTWHGLMDILILAGIVTSHSMLRTFEHKMLSSV